MSPKFRISWPTLISSVSQVISFTLHPFLTRFVLTNISFTFPATLALIQVSTTAVCLWFWSIFGLYHVRPIPLRSLLPLAASAAALALLAVFTLATTSLLVFQTARLLSATTVLAIRTRARIPLLIAFLSSALLALPRHGDLAVPIFYTLFASTTPIFLHPVAVKTRASELQLQVLQRSLTSLILLLPALALDLLSRDSAESMRQIALNDTAIILVVSTGLLAFFSLTASRATAHRLGPETHNWLLLVANLAVFACHFITSDDELHGRQVLGVFGLTAAWSFLAEKRRCGLEESDEHEDGERASREAV